MSDPDDLTDTILWLRARGANIHQQGCTVGGILMPVNTSAAAAPYLASADGKRDIDEKKDMTRQTRKVVSSGRL